MNFSFRYIMLITILILSAMPAMAKEPEKKQDDLDLGFELKTTGSASTYAPIESDKGNVATYSGGIEGAYTFHNVTFSLYNSATGYSWTDTSEIPFGNGNDAPWDALYTIGTRVSYKDMLDKNWRLFGGVALNAAYEKELDDAWGGNAYAGFIYAFNKTWMVRLGASGAINQMGRVSAFPVLGIDYNPGAETGFSASLGMPVTEFRYGFTPRVALRLQGSYDASTFRLADDSTVEREGYVSMSGASTGLFLDAEPFDNFHIIAGPQLGFLRSYAIYDRDGDKQDTYDVGTSVTGSLRLEYTF